MAMRCAAAVNTAGSAALQHAAPTVSTSYMLTAPSAGVGAYRARRTQLCAPKIRLPLRVQALIPVAELAEATAPLAAAVGSGLSFLIGFAIWKFWAYSQIEYITAAMLSRWVPRESGDGETGATVIQTNGGTRELYYYPKNLRQVTVVGENVNKGLIEQAGMQAFVPTLARQQSPANLGFAGANSTDAVVSLGAMAGMSAQQRAQFVGEALRVLKPGRPLIFLERVPGGLPLRTLGAPGATLDPSILQELKNKPQFEEVQWDIALEGQDPHAVGVAFKSASVKAMNISSNNSASKAEAEAEAAERARRREANRPKRDTTKGFTSNKQ